MAAPTAVRVEANSITTTTLRWTYPGTSNISVHRSTNGVAYSEVTAAGTRVVPGITTYIDTGLSVGTKYWYKLSDDGGGTFSSVVTVWTHSCVGPISTADKPVVLPRFDDDETRQILGDTSDVPGFVTDPAETTARLNDMATRIENAFQGREVEPDKCIACPEDGALVLDCSSQCINWAVVADEAINSVSIAWCDKFNGTIDFVIPPNVTIPICGFPAGFGFAGDECTQAPISGGPNGRTLTLGYGPGGMTSPSGAASRPSTNEGVGRGSGAGSSTEQGGGRGGSGCTCVPNEGALTMKSCNPNNSLNCSGSKSLRLLVCGGRGPYTWGKVGGIAISKSAGVETTVTPPANPGSAVGGTAYWHSFYNCSGCAGGVCNAVTGEITVLRNCDDTSSGCTTSSFCTNPAAASMTCGCGAGSPGQPGCGTSPQLCGGCGVGLCATRQAGDGEGRTSVICDQRTAPMIAAGCEPCGLQAGATVTVTDSLGVSVTIIVRP